MLPDPCPYCEEDDPELKRSKALWWYVVCPYCHAAGPTASTSREAIELWNSVIQKET